MLDWSHSKYPPFKHQFEDTEWVIRHPWLFITSEMRTGKTKIVIDGAQFLYHAGIINRVIVVCPEPVRGVWVGANADELGGELREHLWDKTPALITEFHSDVHQWWQGPKLQTLDDVRNNGLSRVPYDATTMPDALRIIVTNYEYIRPYKRQKEAKKNDQQLQKLLKYCNAKTLLVLDESGAVTNPKSESFLACFEMRKKCGRVVLMNGTPMDTPINLFAQGRMLSDSILECRYKTHFLNRYAIQEPITSARGTKLTARGGYQLMKVKEWKNLDDLQARFAPVTIRRLQKDCPDMPTKLPAVTLKAELTATTWKHYRQMRDEMVVELQAGIASISKQAIIKFMRLSQITGGFLGGFEHTGLADPVCESCDGAGCADCEGSGIGAVQPVADIREIGHEKLDVLLWLIGHKLEQNPNTKMVVWTRFLPETLRALHVIEEKFPHIITAGFHGKMTKPQRAITKALLHPTTAPGGPVVTVGTLGTGSFGLDFSAAHINVNYSYDHSLRKFLQSGDRVYGPRQVNPIEYYDIVATGPKGQKTYDAVIVQARRNKHELATWTTDAWVKALSDSAV